MGFKFEMTTMLSLCVMSSMCDNNKLLLPAQTALQSIVKARKAVRIEIGGVNYGEFGGNTAYLSTSDVFGHQERVNDLIAIFGQSHLYCDKLDNKGQPHGWLQGDIGHIFPRALGGALVATMDATTGKTVYYNATLECPRCNRAKGAHLTNEQIAYLAQWEIEPIIIEI